jgi:hypothetical protein
LFNKFILTVFGLFLDSSLSTGFLERQTERERGREREKQSKREREREREKQREADRRN